MPLSPEGPCRLPFPSVEQAQLMGMRSSERSVVSQATAEASGTKAKTARALQLSLRTGLIGLNKNRDDSTNVRFGDSAGCENQIAVLYHDVTED